MDVDTIIDVPYFIGDRYTETMKYLVINSSTQDFLYETHY